MEVTKRKFLKALAGVAAVAMSPLWLLRPTNKKLRPGLSKWYDTKIDGLDEHGREVTEYYLNGRLMCTDVDLTREMQASHRVVPIAGGHDDALYLGGKDCLYRFHKGRCEVIS